STRRRCSRAATASLTAPRAKCCAMPQPCATASACAPRSQRACLRARSGKARHNPQAMGNRLSRITTRTGDAGETGLGDGSRVSKSSLRIHALGEIDELNSLLGVVLAEELPAAAREALSAVQQDLFDLGGETSIPGHQMLGAAPVERLEAIQSKWN